MSISVTKNQETNFNPLKWGALGATAGYVAKYALPITDSEKEYYQQSSVIAERKKAVRSAVDEELSEIKEIIASGHGNEGHDAYVRFIDPPKTSEERAKYLSEVVPTLSEDAKATFNALRTRVDSRVREVKAGCDLATKSMIKALRPAAAYMAVGALFATGVAFVKYAVSKMEYQPQK